MHRSLRWARIPVISGDRGPYLQGLPQLPIYDTIYIWCDCYLEGEQRQLSSVESWTREGRLPAPGKPTCRKAIWLSFLMEAPLGKATSQDRTVCPRPHVWASFRCAAWQYTCGRWMETVVHGCDFCQHSSMMLWSFETSFAEKLVRRPSENGYDHPWVPNCQRQLRKITTT